MSSRSHSRSDSNESIEQVEENDVDERSQVNRIVTHVDRVEDEEEFDEPQEHERSEEHEEEENQEEEEEEIVHNRNDDDYDDYEDHAPYERQYDEDKELSVEEHPDESYSDEEPIDHSHTPLESHYHHNDDPHDHEADFELRHELDDVSDDDLVPLTHPRPGLVTVEDGPLHSRESSIGTKPPPSPSPLDGAIISPSPINISRSPLSSVEEGADPSRPAFEQQQAQPEEAKEDDQPEHREEDVEEEQEIYDEAVSRNSPRIDQSSSVHRTPPTIPTGLDAVEASIRRDRQQRDLAHSPRSSHSSRTDGTPSRHSAGRRSSASSDSDGGPLLPSPSPASRNHPPRTVGQPHTHDFASTQSYSDTMALGAAGRNASSAKKYTLKDASRAAVLTDDDDDVEGEGGDTYHAASYDHEPPSRQPGLYYPPASTNRHAGGSRRYETNASLALSEDEFGPSPTPSPIHVRTGSASLIQGALLSSGLSPSNRPSASLSGSLVGSPRGLIDGALFSSGLSSGSVVTGGRPSNSTSSWQQVTVLNGGSPHADRLDAAASDTAMTHVSMQPTYGSPSSSSNASSIARSQRLRQNLAQSTNVSSSITDRLVELLIDKENEVYAHAAEMRALALHNSRRNQEVIDLIYRLERSKVEYNSMLRDIQSLSSSALHGLPDREADAIADYDSAPASPLRRSPFALADPSRLSTDAHFEAYARALPSPAAESKSQTLVPTRNTVGSNGEPAAAASKRNEAGETERHFHFDDGQATRADRMGDQPNERYERDWTESMPMPHTQVPQPTAYYHDAREINESLSESGSAAESGSGREQLYSPASVASRRTQDRSPPHSYIPSRIHSARDFGERSKGSLVFGGDGTSAQPDSHAQPRLEHAHSEQPQSTSVTQSKQNFNVPPLNIPRVSLPVSAPVTSRDGAPVEVGAADADSPRADSRASSPAVGDANPPTQSSTGGGGEASVLEIWDTALEDDEEKETGATDQPNQGMEAEGQESHTDDTHTASEEGESDDDDQHDPDYSPNSSITDDFIRAEHRRQASLEADERAERARKRPDVPSLQGLQEYVEQQWKSFASAAPSPALASAGSSSRTPSVRTSQSSRSDQRGMSSSPHSSRRVIRGGDSSSPVAPPQPTPYTDLNQLPVAIGVDRSAPSLSIPPHAPSDRQQPMSPTAPPKWPGPPSARVIDQQTPEYASNDTSDERVVSSSRRVASSASASHTETTTTTLVKSTSATSTRSGRDESTRIESAETFKQTTTSVYAPNASGSIDDAHGDWLREQRLLLASKQSQPSQPDRRPQSTRQQHTQPEFNSARTHSQPTVERTHDEPSMLHPAVRPEPESPSRDRSSSVSSSTTATDAAWRIKANEVESAVDRQGGSRRVVDDRAERERAQAKSSTGTPTMDVSTSSRQSLVSSSPLSDGGSSSPVNDPIHASLLRDLHAARSDAARYKDLVIRLKKDRIKLKTKVDILKAKLAKAQMAPPPEPTQLPPTPDEINTIPASAVIDREAQQQDLLIKMVQNIEQLRRKFAKEKEQRKALECEVRRLASGGHVNPTPSANEATRPQMRTDELEEEKQQPPTNNQQSTKRYPTAQEREAQLRMYQQQQQQHRHRQPFVGDNDSPDSPWELLDGDDMYVGGAVRSQCESSSSVHVGRGRPRSPLVHILPNGDIDTAAAVRRTSPEYLAPLSQVHAASHIHADAMPSSSASHSGRSRVSASSVSRARSLSGARPGLNPQLLKDQDELELDQRRAIESYQKREEERKRKLEEKRQERIRSKSAERNTHHAPASHQTHVQSTRSSHVAPSSLSASPLRAPDSDPHPSLVDQPLHTSLNSDVEGFDRRPASALVGSPSHRLPRSRWDWDHEVSWQEQRASKARQESEQRQHASTRVLTRHTQAQVREVRPTLMNGTHRFIREERREEERERLSRNW